MTYSQRKLIELMEAGMLSCENIKPKRVETVISNVFIFRDLVYKIYKNDNGFFNKGFKDLSSTKDRHSFTREDFKWNHSLSPSIYIKLVGLSVRDDKIYLSTPTNKEEELCIVMNRVNEADVLFEKLMRDDITKENCTSMGKQLAETLKRMRVKTHSGHNYYKLFGDRISDVRKFISHVDDCISTAESSMYCEHMDAIRNEEREWFEKKLSAELADAGDIHSCNAALVGDSLYLIDTFSPKKDWRLEHNLVPFYRLGTDIWALSGDKEKFEAFARGYEMTSGVKIDRRLDDLYIVYAASIMVSYLYMLQKTDPAKKEAAVRYHDFIRRHTGYVAKRK